MLNPICFSIPEEKVVNNIPLKTKILSNLIPGNFETYIYNNETEYYNEYRQSMFAITNKRGGWDCMRHYEIIANGCIPYFNNINNCPEKTLSLLPKNLLIEGNLLYDSLKYKKFNELTETDIHNYNNLVIRFIEHMKRHLTTNKMAKYILEKTNNLEVNRILFLSGYTDPDYLRCVTLEGFKEIMGINCHDYPKVPHIYKSDNINYSNLYGKGITYTNLLERELHDDNLDSTIEEDIKNKYYDIVIYGSYHRSMPYYDLISKIYDPNKIILLCGEDEHNCNYNIWLDKGHYVFIRELT